MTKTIKGKKTTARKAPNGIGAARLAEMIEEATVDAYDDSEQATGWFTIFEEHLDLPFETEVLGVRVTVEDDHLGRLPREVSPRHAVPHLGDTAPTRVHRERLHPR